MSVSLAALLAKMLALSLTDCAQGITRRKVLLERVVTTVLFTISSELSVQRLPSAPN